MGTVARTRTRTAEEIAADLDVRIADVGRKIERLSGVIDARFKDLEIAEITEIAQIKGLIALFSQLSSCLAQLVRVRQQVKGDGADELSQAIDLALDRLSDEWEVEL